MRFLILFCISSFLFIGCQKPAANVHVASPNAKRYSLKGTVMAVDKAAKKATIKHEAVEGYMEGMTMDFPIHADWIWNDLTVGSDINADLVVDSGSPEPYWLENVQIIAAARPDQANVPVNDAFAQIGHEIPDFTLTNQDGKRISIKDFRGKALAITFIYAKCPLPDYCIRMSTNFSDVAMQLEKDAEWTDKIRLLSISFDPANDTPEKLKAYGIGYMGNDPKTKFEVWQLAVGKDAEVKTIADFFGLQYEVDPNDKAKINHSLRTAVIDANGKVAKIFTGNEWTPAQLLTELKAAASPK
jgi:protein SCO1/2